MHGTYETLDGRPAVRFERRLEHPVEVVWRAVTEPDELRHWFPATVTLDPRPGGRIEFASDHAPTTDGEVTVFDPPHRFAFTWGGSLVSMELDAEDGGAACRLTFTHVLEAREAAARDAAGWHVCLDRLEDRLARRPAEAPGGDATAEWRGHYDEYRRRGVPEGAPVPGETRGA